MFHGDSIPGCQNCIEQERWGKTSFRQLFNSEWAHLLGEQAFANRVNDSAQNNFHVSSPPVYLDLRPGNICNLKCRMCNPINSSKWGNEYRELFETNNRFKEVVIDAYGGDLRTFASPHYNDWVNSNKLWDEVFDLIPSLKKIYLTGGEPTIIEKNYHLLEKIIEMGYQDQLLVFLNTNACNIPPRFIEILKKFKHPMVNISIDGVGKLNEYIRYPSSWSSVDANIRSLAQIPQLVMNLTPVLQVYNLHHILDVFSYAQQLATQFKQNIGVDVLYNTHPFFLDVRILPPELREQPLQMITDFEQKNHSSNQMISNSVRGLRGFLQNAQREAAPFYQKQFWDYTNILDKKRNQSLREICPEIYNFFYHLYQ